MSGRTQLEFSGSNTGGGPPARESLAGCTIDGRYRLDALLGEGGMGAVYRGEQIYLHRPVAVKVLHPEFAASADAVARFRREAELMARLDSRHIVQVMDFGVTPEGRFYLVLELLEGESLHDLLSREGRLQPAAAVDLLNQLLDGLGAAHGAGVVHRDLKPENLWLTPAGQGRLLKILDFGIAKLAADEGESDGMTKTGWIVGTPEYLSPEQALGRQVDRRADLYSVGIIGYRMLTGRHPFGDAEPRAMLQAQILTPVPSAAEAVPGLSGHTRLLELITRATEKDVEKRAQSASELAGILAGEGKWVELHISSSSGAPVAGKKPILRSPVLWLAVLVLAAAGWFGSMRLSQYFKARPVVRAEEAIERGRPLEALRELSGSENTAEVLTLKGRAYFKMDRYEDGLKSYQAAAAKDKGVLSRKGVIEDIAGEFKGPRAETAAQLLEMAGDPAVEFLSAAASDKDFKTRWRAIDTLKRMNRADKADMAAAYIADLRLTDCAVVKRAAKALGDLGDRRAVEPIKEVARRKKSFFWEACEVPAARAALVKIEKARLAAASAEDPDAGHGQEDDTGPAGSRAAVK
jgi:serine/threonine-protein kinase